MKKLMCYLLAGLMLLNIISPSVSMAQNLQEYKDYPNSEELSQLSEEEQIEYWAQNFELYFSEIGHLQKDGSYVIDNPERLLEEVKKGDKSAEKLYDLYLESKQAKENRDVNSFVKCVINDQFGWLRSFIKGDMLEGLEQALLSGAWSAAGKIMSTAIMQASKIEGKAVGWAYTGASVALSMYNCRNKW